MPRHFSLREYFSREPLVRWKRISSLESENGVEHGEDVQQQQLFPPQEDEIVNKMGQKRRKTWFHASLIANFVLLVLLAMSWIAVDQVGLRAARYSSSNAPYSPIEEAGLIRTISRKFEADWTIQGPPGLEATDRAWNNTLLDKDGIVGLPKSVADRMQNEAVESWWKPGHYGYGISVYHQLHCLDKLRKQFYPDMYPTSDSPEELIEHRHHCLDYLRQGIQCAGDVALDYFWNDAYTEIGPDGTHRYSADYLRKTVKERSRGALSKWDVVHQCRDLGPVREWAEKWALPEEPRG